MTPAARIEGLAADVVPLLQAAARGIDTRDFENAGRALQAALARAPGHPEVMRLQGVLAYVQNRFADAVPILRRALEAWPDDALILGNLGSALVGSGDAEGALRVFRRACEAAPQLAAAWFNFGKLLEAEGDTSAASAALARATQADPGHVSARILYGETLNMLGHTEQAAAQFREVLRKHPHNARAWIGLANLKTIPLRAEEEQALQRSFVEPSLGEDDRAIVGFALGKVLEDQERYVEAFAALSEANALKRRSLPWDAAAHSDHVDAIARIFTDGTARTPDPTLGREVIFIVGLPRSGSTLIEQILAAHPEVAGASELPDLEVVLTEESQRRRRAFPDWVASATSADWERLGRRYLERTARWRVQRSRSTDKRPENWAFVGAALAMLPGARVIDCRRDALETSWSCFKQLFGPGRLPAAYDLRDIAHYLRDHDRLTRLWRQRDAARFREQDYERLLADPESEIRDLLAFCDLPFDAACLRFQEADRAIRTVSAAQVRQPLRRDTARAARYGDLLAPLREALYENSTGDS